jgi:hypothetical protein
MPSSVIRTFHYRKDEEALEITFTSGKRYRYLQVPEDVYRGMQLSFSKGEYFNRHIRQRFVFERLLASPAA